MLNDNVYITVGYNFVVASVEPDERVARYRLWYQADGVNFLVGRSSLNVTLTRREDHIRHAVFDVCFSRHIALVSLRDVRKRRATRKQVISERQLRLFED